MNRYRCDLHLHSCLSPCADDDMTPGNIAGMAAVANVQVAALTDHNSVRNCPAFFSACKQYGVVPIPGMELCTAEEIHLICLFPSLPAAMAFGTTVEGHRMAVQNRPGVFGNQLVLGADDAPAGTEDTLLLTATDLPLPDAAALCLSHGGACYPAHIDRDAYSVLSVLGQMPEIPFFPTVEFSSQEKQAVLSDRPDLAGRRRITASDAHRLWNVGDCPAELSIEDTPYSGDRVRQALIALLRKGIRI